MWMEQAKRARIQDGAGINVEAVLLLLLDQNQDLCLVVGFSSAKKKKIRAAGMEGLVVNSSASWSFELLKYSQVEQLNQNSKVVTSQNKYMCLIHFLRCSSSNSICRSQGGCKQGTTSSAPRSPPYPTLTCS